MLADYISNKKLRASSLPTHDADWLEIVKFANTFPVSDPAVIDDEVVTRYRVTGFWQGTLSELRAHLHLEWLEYRHKGTEPSGADLERIQDP